MNKATPPVPVSGNPGANFVQVMPPAGFGTQGNGKSDQINTTTDPKGLMFDFNRDNVLYNIQPLLNHARSGGRK